MNLIARMYSTFFIALLILPSCKKPITSTDVIAQLHLHTLPKDSLILVDEQILKQQNSIAYLNNVQNTGISIIAWIDKKLHNAQSAHTAYASLNSLGFVGSCSHEAVGFVYHHYKPIFYKGVLMTDLAPRDKVIGMWLDAMPLPITTVVFISCNEQDMDEIKRNCKQRKLRFKGHHVAVVPKDPILDCLQQNENSAVRVATVQSNVQP